MVLTPSPQRFNCKWGNYIRSRRVSLLREEGNESTYSELRDGARVAEVVEDDYATVHSGLAQGATKRREVETNRC